MNIKDRNTISHHAKNETELFINFHLDDHTKGWPTIRDDRAEKPNLVEDRRLDIEKWLNKSDRKETTL